MNANITLNEDITPIGTDYDTVRGVIELLTLDYREQPSLEAIAAELGQSPTQLQKTFTRWAGLSPKAFLQAVTLDHAKRLLREEDLPLLETSIEVGMSGPGRLHDLRVDQRQHDLRLILAQVPCRHPDRHHPLRDPDLRRRQPHTRYLAQRIVQILRQTPHMPINPADLHRPPPQNRHIPLNDRQPGHG